MKNTNKLNAVQLCGKDLYKIIKRRGITTLCNETIWLDYSCSGIELEIEGTEVKIEIVSNLQTTNYAWIDIYVDTGLGVDRATYIIDKEEQWITVNKQKTPGNIKIVILKRTEKKYESVGVRNVCFHGEIIPHQDNHNKVIEFIGDSISCGYGVENFSIFHKFATRYENGLKAFPYLLCEMLEADYEIIAYSGIGVWRSHRNFTGGVAQEVYETEYKRQECHRDKQLIIINVGTNDSKHIHSTHDILSFEDSYEKLLYCVRKRNPYAKIICAIGPMKCRLTASINKICCKMNKIGDGEIYFIKLSRKFSDGIGEGKHPTHLSQRRIARQLYDFCIEKTIERVE